MVNNVYLINEKFGVEATSNQKSMPSSFFQLSAPLGASVSSEVAKCKLHTNTFTFLEPFEPFHLSQSNGGGKTLSSRHTNPVRAQPYSLTKPKAQQIVNKSQENERPISLTSHNNPILSRLSSISNSFKSIFVRPKLSKPVDLDSFNPKSKQIEINKEETKFKLNLFSVVKCSSQNNGDSTMRDDVERPAEINYDMNQKLERIISKNVRQEIRRIEADAKSILPSSSNASVKSTISSMSSISSVSIPEPHRRLSSAAHQHAAILSSSTSTVISSTNKAPPILTNLSNNSNKKATTVTNNLPKWTCMICLSKHQIDVKICSICGSSNQDQVNVKPNSSFAMPATKYKQELATSVANGALKAINNNAVPNFLKTWLCHYCNFANDSLKVVCMNCRAGKKHNSTNHGVKLQHQSVQMKRLRAEMDSIKQPKSKQVRSVQVAKCGCDNLNKSNEENEFDQEEDDEEEETSRKKKAKQDTRKDQDTSSVCTKCKCDLSNKKESEEEITKPSTLITPIKPDNFDKVIKFHKSEEETKKTANPPPPPDTNVPPLNSLFKLNTQSKWTCDTCLASNEETRTCCACCQSSRPVKGLDKTDSSNASNISKPPVKPSLFSTQTSSKWTCSTCLVQNESEIVHCICCSTAKQSSNEEPVKTKFSSLIAAQGSSFQSTSSSVVSSISFGLSGSSSVNEPIKFGSNKSFSIDLAQSKPKSDQESVPIKFGSSLDMEPAQNKAKTNEDSIAPSKPLFFGSTSNQATKSFPNFSSQSNESTKSQDLFKASSTATVSNSEVIEVSKPINGLAFGQTSALFSTSQSTSLFGVKQESTQTFNAPANPNKPMFDTFASKLPIANPFLQEPKKSSDPSLTQGIDQAKTKVNLEFGSSKRSEPVTQTQTNLFGKPTENLSDPSANKEKPILFGSSGFGSSSSNSFAPSKPDIMFGSSNLKTSSSSNDFFASSNTGSSAVSSFGANSSTSKPSFTSLSTEPPAKPFTFGSSNSNIAPPSNNLFTSNNNNNINSNTLMTQTKASSSNSSFLFGQSSTSQTPAPTPSFNFIDNKSLKRESNFENVQSTAFKFNSQSNFNFGDSLGTAPVFGSGNTTPLKTPSTASASTPFVFGGSTDSPSLQQALTPSTTSSARLIKKPTRRLKK